MTRAAALIAALALIVIRPPQPGEPTLDNVMDRVCAYHMARPDTLTKDWRKFCEHRGIRLA